MLTTIKLALDCSRAFDIFVDDLSTGIARLDLYLEAVQNGRVMKGTEEVGRVQVWQPHERIFISWRLTTWEPEKPASIEVLFKPVDGGTQVSVEHRGLESVLGDADTLGWIASEIIAPFFVATTPEMVGDWITDRRARRPFGADARSIYRDPLYHYPNFRVILGIILTKCCCFSVDKGKSTIESNSADVVC